MKVQLWTRWKPCGRRRRTRNRILVRVSGRTRDTAAAFSPLFEWQSTEFTNNENAGLSYLDAVLAIVDLENYIFIPYLSLVNYCIFYDVFILKPILSKSILYSRFFTMTLEGSISMDNQDFSRPNNVRSGHGRREERDRRSGLDTRSEEEKRIIGERRSGVDRRTVADRRK